MSSKAELIEEMSQIVSGLVDNAEQLQEVSTGAIAEEELNELQGQQEDLLLQLVQVDQKLSEQFKAPASGPVWDEIQKGLERFEELNQKFIDNLVVRKGLIGFELKNVKKTRKWLKEVKATYAKPQKEKRSRIDKTQ